MDFLYLSTSLYLELSLSRTLGHLHSSFNFLYIVFLLVVNASFRFYNGTTRTPVKRGQDVVNIEIGPLNTVVNPEEKRKIIGDTFIKVKCYREQQIRGGFRFFFKYVAIFKRNTKISRKYIRFENRFEHLIKAKIEKISQTKFDCSNKYCT